MRANTIAIIAFDRISPFHLSIPCAIFGEDPGGQCPVKFKVKVCTLEEGTISTSAGFRVETSYRLKELTQASIVIVPSWRDINEIPPKRMLDALRRAHQRGSMIVGLCLGTYVLAAAGLLDGLEATTHWYRASDLAARYPAIKVNPDVLYVDQGNIITSAGSASAIDCCLHILRRDYGTAVANYKARRMVVSPHRQGGQAQFIEMPISDLSHTDHFANVLEWCQKNLNKTLSLDILAKRAYMTRRTFTRRFKQVMGETVGEWLLTQRLMLAQHLLETTDRPIDVIAENVGFGSAVSLRQHFNRKFQISPSHYRQEFSV